MLTREEIEEFRNLVKQESGEEISFETASEWANSVYELMLFLTCPPNEFYYRLNNHHKQKKF